MPVIVTQGAFLVAYCYTHIGMASYEFVRYFTERKVKNAESAFPRMIKMLKETIGPKINVIGNAIKLAPGTDAGANDKSVP